MTKTQGPTFAEIGDSSTTDRPKYGAPDLLVEEIWKELGGQVTREQIRDVAMGVAAEFDNAAVTTFVPIFIRRRTFERLKRMIDERG